VSIKNLEDSAINKLRIQQEETVDLEELNDEKGDDFEKIYKGEVSKSGTSILPSKRVRRVPEKALISSEEKNQEDNSQKEEIKEEDIKSLSEDDESKI
jgi:DNA-directed RNA polymerase subunit omega